MFISRPSRRALKERQKKLEDYKSRNRFFSFATLKKLVGFGLISKYHYFSFFILGFIFSLAPNFSEVFYEPIVGDLTFPSEEYILIEEERSPLANISDEGFLQKMVVPTEESNRKRLTDIVEYQIQKGDTLSAIATRFGVSVNTIMDVNELTWKSLLRIGDTLTIIPVEGLLHIVKKGDSVSEIAKKYKVEENQVVAQNKLEGTNVALVPGVKLIIPGGVKPVPPVPVRQVTSLVATLRSPTTSEVSTDIRRGGHEIEAPAPSGKLYAPVFGGVLTQGYSYSHRALDIGSNQGKKTGIYAAANGVVEKSFGSGWNSGYGNYIIIDHLNGMKTLYAHLSANLVQAGDTVRAGQLIARMGNTGKTHGPTGVHLHFEVILNGKKVSPANYL